MPSPVEVKNRWERILTSIPGVVGVAAEDDKIVVFVEREDVQVPANLEGVPVVKRVTDRIRAR